jgi:hypothetical protein
MGWLEGLPDDYTYRQTADWEVDGTSDSYYSLDLVSATDRFPVSFQEFVLGKIFGEEYAAS